MYASLIKLLDNLLYLLLAWKRTSDIQKAQKERYESEINPAAWFARHFPNGVQHSDSAPSEQASNNETIIDRDTEK